MAASARRRSSSQRALSPRSGVSKPTRRYTAPFKRTVSPSITSMIWPDGLTLLRCHIIHAAIAAAPSAIAPAARERRVRAGISIDVEMESRATWRSRYILKFHAIYCLRPEERGPIMDMVLSFLISAGIIAFGVWVVVGTITAGWPLAWTIMGLLAILVGVLSLYGSVRDARTP